MEEKRIIPIAILGSGSGTNAAAICAREQSSACRYKVSVVFATKSDAGLCDIARRYGKALIVLPWAESREMSITLLRSELGHRGVKVLALAGFMNLLPMSVVDDLDGMVVNIHPALLPDFGGKGMYGLKVHKAVLDAGCSTTGATVHLVTQEYDEGGVLGSRSVEVLPSDTPEMLQQRVKHAEHQLYPEVLDRICREIANEIDLSQIR